MASRTPPKRPVRGKHRGVEKRADSVRGRAAQGKRRAPEEASRRKRPTSRDGQPPAPSRGPAPRIDEEQWFRDQEQYLRDLRSRPVPPGYFRDPSHPMVLSPRWPLPGDLYQRLREELIERVRRQGLPRPGEYERWYQESNVESLRRAIAPLIRTCARCGQWLEDSAGRLLLSLEEEQAAHAMSPRFVPRPDQRNYCSLACREAGRQQRWREKNPEHKLRRQSP